MGITANYTKHTKRRMATSPFSVSDFFRVVRVVRGPSSGMSPWTLACETRYTYDGWRVIQERDVNNTPTVSYTRGTDLSGSLEGAGGIGGLLARSHGYASTNGNWYTHNFYHADGNGNITYLVNSSQTLAASYRYDPFGNTLSSSGTLANGNVYRFSSKEVHANSGLYYYGYRFYAPNLQRWLNRDPLGEPGFETLRRKQPSILGDGPNRYLFVRNNPVSKVDYLGLSNTPLHRGECCNNSDRDEWALVSEGDPAVTYWKKLAPGECVGGITGKDCEGFSCKGGFYKVGGSEKGGCRQDPCKPSCGSRRDNYNDRRWTPNSQGSTAEGPGKRGAPSGDTPPEGYSWKGCGEQ